MRVDVLHNFSDGIGKRPCGLVALTLYFPHGAGQEVKPENVAWPKFKSGDMVTCGTCGGYAGESLTMESSKPHTCVPLARPDGRFICRAGCDAA